MFRKLFSFSRKRKGLDKWKVPPSDQRSLQQLVDSANRGNTESQAILSLLYMNGNAGNQDIGKAFELIEKASSDFYSLNMCYKAGVERKEPGAHFGLFAMWKNGWGVPRNQEIANKHLIEAANSNFPKAMLVLGLEYQSGFCGIERDIEQAEKWLLKAVETGEEANSHLHHIYYKEEGFIDYERAYEYVLKAANTGRPASFNHLAKMYENGKGVEKDLVQAAKYYYLAECQGKPKAVSERSSLVRVCKALGTEEIQKVRRLALEWIKNSGRTANKFNAFNEHLSDPLSYYEIQQT